MPALLCILLLAIFGAAVAGKEGMLDVEVEGPRWVREKESVSLRCHFQLKGESLYTLKWYKGHHEFYRVTPKEEPFIKTFPVPNNDIRIDPKRSDKFQVTLENVDVNATGRYTCEVTTDAPDFTSESKTAFLTVVSYPREAPVITGFRRPYSLRDTVDLTCSSRSSKPAANLTWFINDQMVRGEYLTHPKTVKTREGENRESSHLGIRFLLRESHFLSGPLRLRCTAEIYNLYKMSSEVVIEDDRPKLSSVVDNASPNLPSSNSMSHGAWSSNYSTFLITFNFIALLASIFSHL